MVTSIYPSAIASFPTRVDYANIVDASDFNALAAEIVAIQTALGINPTLGFGASTISGALTALNSGKSNTAHTHINLSGTPTTIGGAITGSYVAISGRTIQGYTASAPAALNIQASGGDTTLGVATTNTTVNGSLKVNGIATFTSTTVAGTATTNKLSVSNLSTLSTIHLNGNEIYLWNPQSPAVVPGHNSEGIYASGTYTTVFDGDPTFSTKNVQGQLFVEQIPQGPSGGWDNASIQMYRPNNGTGLHFECNLGAKAWSDNANGYRQALLTFNANSSTLGWISQDGTANSHTNFALTASSFITSSAENTKIGVTEIDTGLEAIQKLRPVSYIQKTHAEMEGPYSIGDSMRVRTRSHGLIAEEVARVIPEVVSYNPDGSAHGIDYGAIVPTLIKSIQTLTDKVQALEARLANQ